MKSLLEFLKVNISNLGNHKKGYFFILFVKIFTFKLPQNLYSQSNLFKFSSSIIEEKLVWERQNAISKGFYPIVVFLTRIHDLKASVTAKVVVCMYVVRSFK